MCSELTSVTIPNSVTKIGRHAFLNCEKLSNITIPNSVTLICEESFCGCQGITSLVIPESVTNIEGRAFYGCHNLKTVSLPNSITAINASTFYGCNNLNSINIPNSVTTIDRFAFYQCSALTSIVIPNSVDSIGKSAFSGCKSLTSVTSYITDVFETGEDAFQNCTNATLYVPNGLIETYQSTADWSRLTRIEGIPGVSLILACSDQGKVTINDFLEFANNIGETVVYDGTENTFVFTPEEGCRLDRVLINGLDVTKSVKNNRLTAQIMPNSKMMVVFSSKGEDINGDGVVNIADVISIVNTILEQ